MPINLGKGPNVVAASNVLFGSGTGGVDAQKVVFGTGTGIVTAWERKKKFSDNFEYGAEAVLPSPPWFVTGTPPYNLVSNGGNVRVYNDGSDGAYSSNARWLEKVATDAQFSKGKLVNIGSTSRGTWVAINGNMVAGTFVGAQWTGNTIQMFNNLSTVTTARSAAITRTQVAGDWFEIRSEIVSGKPFYSCLVNGTVVQTWNDSTNAAPWGDSYRSVGFGMQRNRSFFTTTHSTQFSDWEGGDF